MKKIYTLLLLPLLMTAVCGLHSLTATAQSVSLQHYYSLANGKKKAELKTAMYQIVGNPTVKSYSSLWTHYYDTDRLPDNQVVDRYSNNKRYFSGQNGSVVSGMNKEHGIPQSWWGGGTTGIGSDLHHVMPSDADANSRKSNYGMGVVTSQTWTNGSIKVGRGEAGNNGNVQLWEPADEWKGDFARAYFYIVTAYEEKSLVQKEGANTMQTTTYPKLQPWASQLYLKWARQDPVSDLERQRNEAVYKIQGNRNPFVDFPSLAEYIWGDSINYAFFVNADHQIDPINPDTTQIDPIHPDTTQVDTTQVDPIDPLEPTGKSGTVDVNSYEWMETQSGEYGSGFATNANGLTLAYYKYRSNVNPVSVNQYNELRFYANSLFVISGAEIIKVVFHSSGRTNDMTIDNQVYSFSNGLLTWIGSMCPFMAEASGGQSRFTSIDITVKDTDGVLTNYMSPIGGRNAVFDMKGRYLGTECPTQRGVYIIRQNGKTHKHFVH